MPLLLDSGQRPLQACFNEPVPLSFGKRDLVAWLADPDGVFIDLDGRTRVAGGTEAHHLFGFHFFHLLSRQAATRGCPYILDRDRRDASAHLVGAEARGLLLGQPTLPKPIEPSFEILEQPDLPFECSGFLSRPPHHGLTGGLARPSQVENVSYLGQRKAEALSLSDEEGPLQIRLGVAAVVRMRPAGTSSCDETGTGVSVTPTWPWAVARLPGCININDIRTASKINAIEHE